MEYKGKRMKLGLLDKILIASGVVCLGIFSTIQPSASPPKRKIDPIAWYDINGDGVNDAIISRHGYAPDIRPNTIKFALQTKDGKSLKKEVDNFSILDGKTITKSENGEYFSDGNEIDLRIDDPNPLHYTVPVINRIGDFNNDGKLDIEITRYDEYGSEKTTYMGVHPITKPKN